MIKGGIELNSESSGKKPDEFDWGNYMKVNARTATEFMTIKLHENIARITRMKAGDRVLDLGAGFGGSMITADRITPGNVIGIELNEKLIEFGCGNPETKHLANRINQGDITKPLPFENESFDIVLAFYVIYTLNESGRINAIKEAKRVLKRQGRFAMVNLYKYRSTKGVVRMNVLRSVMHHKWHLIQCYKHISSYLKWQKEWYRQVAEIMKIFGSKDQIMFDKETTIEFIEPFEFSKFEIHMMNPHIEFSIKRNFPFLSCMGDSAIVLLAEK